MALPFELFVAWRYLRERGRRSGWVTLAIGVLMLVGAGLSFYFAGRYNHLHPYELTDTQRLWKQDLSYAGLGLLVLGVLVCVFGFFHSLQSIFTTISTFGIFLGSMALVIVLSVMNGFEADLRHKILGSNAHVLVTREDGSFTEWRDVERTLDGLCAPRGPCVVAHTPYVTSEVVVAADSNYQPVVIKGIDPRTVGRVTDLARNVAQGSLERVWPLLPDGGVAERAAHGPPDAGAGGPGDEEPQDFSKPGTDDEPEDFSHGADAGTEALPPPSRPRPMRPDPRVSSLDGILVGRELAKNLRLYEGEEVQVISPLGRETPTGQVPRTRPFRVAGIFFTGMYEYDAKIVYVSIPALQSFLSLGDEVTGVEIKASDINATQRLVDAIQRKLGAAYRVKDWKELNRGLFSALKLEQIAMFLVLTIIILVASFSIISNLIMVVVEKSREIAILKSMGASDWAVMRVFVAEGFYIGLLGTTVGLGVGLVACWALDRFGLPLNSDVYYIDRLPVAVDPLSIFAVALAGLVISVVVTIYPAYVGARLRPIDGLRQ